jgi:hypothetical protein
MAAAGCARGPAAEQLLTYYNAEYALTVGYPASWRSEQVRQGDGTYHYFNAPATGTDRKPAVSVLLIAGQARAGLDEFAKPYLSGLTVSETREEARPGARGRTWSAISADGKNRERLLLLQEENRVYGLRAQADADSFAKHDAAIDEMIKSFRLERWALYTEERSDPYRYVIKLPPTWRSTRTFSGGGTLLKQWTSPALGMDKGGQTVHAALTLTVEDVAPTVTAASFHQAMQAKLGSNFQLLAHTPWKDGFVDTLRTESTMSESRGKRFYRIAANRAYTLAFEARGDVYPRVSRWCDMIASTLKTGAELDAKAEATPSAAPSAEAP